MTAAAPLRVGSDIVGALEALWRDVQALHPSTPDVLISLGFVKRTLGYSYGRHVVITFDALKGEPLDVVGVLVHEAIHQELRVSGARDWHRHLGTFRKAAARFGLEPETHRYGSATLTAERAAHYSARDSFAQLERAMSA